MTKVNEMLDYLRDGIRAVKEDKPVESALALAGLDLLQQVVDDLHRIADAVELIASDYALEAAEEADARIHADPAGQA